MFRLVRTAVLLLIAFGVGIKVEQSNARAACETAQGVWSSGLCLVGETAND